MRTPITNSTRLLNLLDRLLILAAISSVAAAAYLICTNFVALR